MLPDFVDDVEDELVAFDKLPQLSPCLVNFASGGSQWSSIDGQKFGKRVAEGEVVVFGRAIGWI